MMKMIGIIDDTYGFEKGCRYYEGYAPTIRSERIGLKVMSNKYRIRKLTPKECWRLMGFSDEAFDRAKWYSKEESSRLLAEYPKHFGKRKMTEDERYERVSDTQLYKQAGNSIVTNVLYYIFKELYDVMPYLFEDLKVSSYFSGIGAFEFALNMLFNDINSENFQVSQMICPTSVK